MKKWGFFGVLLVLFIPNVYGASLNKTISNPYDIATYVITDRDNNTTYDSGSANDGSLYNLSFNSIKSFNFKADISFLSSANEGNLDIGDGVLFYNDETNLKYWIVPMCVNKYDFYVSMNSGNCPACMEKSSDVTILYGDSNTCSFFSNDFVGPFQYLSDPSKGTIAYLIFKVKQYRVPDTFLTATANDNFTIYNNRSDSTFVYKFLNINSNIGGLFDSEGRANFRLSHYTRDYAILQNDNINSQYKCDSSYNILDVSQGSYFSNDTLTMSTSTLPYIRNLNEKNLWQNSNYMINPNIGNDFSYTDTGFTFNRTTTGGRYIAKAIQVQNGKTYTFSYSKSANPSNELYMYIYRGGVYQSVLASTNNDVLTYTSTADETLYFTFIINSGLKTATASNIQVEVGNKSPYVPYSVYGFNNIISNYNSTSFNFIETNLISKGKIQACVKYKDDVTNEYNVICDDFISGTNRLYYTTEWFNYSECPSPFVWMCGRKMPQVVQFQLLDTFNSYYFTNPLLYSQDVEWSNFFGYVSSIDVGLVTPSYAPPNIVLCKDNDKGILYNYSTREVIYDSNSSEYQFNKSIIQDNQINSIFGDYELPDSFGLSGLIDIPINFIQTVRTGQCQPVNITFNIKNRNVNGVSLPCGNTFWNRSDMSNFRPFLSTFVTGYFIYQVLYSLFFWIRNKRNPVKITHDDGTEELMIL